jgi:hypothetical protein
MTMEDWRAHHLKNVRTVRIVTDEIMSNLSTLKILVEGDND